MAETTAQKILDWRGQLRDTLTDMRKSLEDTSKGTGVLVDARNVVIGAQNLSSSQVTGDTVATLTDIRDKLQQATNSVDAALALIPG